METHWLGSLRLLGPHLGPRTLSPRPPMHRTPYIRPLPTAWVWEPWFKASVSWKALLRSVGRPGPLTLGPLCVTPCCLPLPEWAGVVSGMLGVSQPSSELYGRAQLLAPTAASCGWGRASSGCSEAPGLDSRGRGSTEKSMTLTHKCSQLALCVCMLDRAFWPRWSAGLLWEEVLWPWEQVHAQQGDGAA